MGSQSLREIWIWSSKRLKIITITALLLKTCLYSEGAEKQTDTPVVLSWAGVAGAREVLGRDPLSAVGGSHTEKLLP